MYKLLTSSKGSDDLSIGFDRDRTRRRNELTNNKNIKGKIHIRIYLKDVFGFAEYQGKGTYGLGYKLTLTRNTDNAVLDKGNAINFGKVKINAIELFVPHYTASVQQKKYIIYTNFKQNTYRAPLSRKICLYERGKYSKYLDF